MNEKKRLFVFFIPLLFSLVVVFSRATFGEESYAYGKFKSEESHFTFAALTELIQSKDIKSIEDFLSNLPEELRKNFVLMYESRSLQGASFQSPRAILYGNKGSLVLSFNGDPSQKGFNAIEVIEYNAGDSRHEMHEIQFSENKTSKPIISEPNPKTCLKCHGNPPKPIWDSYPFWPGAYGSNDDLLKGSPTTELEEYKKFWKNRDSHPRYKWLMDSKLRDQVLGDVDGGPNMVLTVHFGNQMAEKTAARIVGSPEYFPLRYAILGALECTYNSLNGEVEPSEFRIENFFPASMKRRRGISDYRDEYYESKSNALSNRVMRLKNALSEANPAYKGFLNSREDMDKYNHEKDVPNLRYVLEGTSLDLRSVSTSDFPTETLTFGTGLGSSLNVLKGLLWKNFLDKDADSDLRKYFSESTSKPKSAGSLDRSQACKLLQGKSLKALSRSPRIVPAIPCNPAQDSQPISEPVLGTIRKLSERTRAYSVFNTCIKCHTVAATGAPQIPFDSPSDLSEVLTKAGHVHGTLIEEIQFRLNDSGAWHMPKFGTLSSEEKQEIESYIVELSRRSTK